MVKVWPKMPLRLPPNNKKIQKICGKYASYAAEFCEGKIDTTI